MSERSGQIVDARVWIGFHFRNSVEQGRKLANDVAEWALDRYFQPSRRHSRLRRMTVVGTSTTTSQRLTHVLVRRCSAAASQRDAASLRQEVIVR